MAQVCRLPEKSDFLLSDRQHCDTHEAALFREKEKIHNFGRQSHYLADRVVEAPGIEPGSEKLLCGVLRVCPTKYTCLRCPSAAYALRLLQCFSAPRAVAPRVTQPTKWRQTAGPWILPALTEWTTY